MLSQLAASVNICTQNVYKISDMSLSTN